MPSTQKPSPDDYARTTIKGKNKYAHRIAYEFAFGKIPDDMTIDHLCRNKSCINVAHMEVVSRGENTKRRFIYQTHCKNGHLLAGSNLEYQSSGYRRCRTCSLASKRKYNKKVYYGLKNNKNK